jgi:hypothetical protein
MRMIPYRTFSIETHLTPPEALARLQTAIEPVRWFRWSRPQRLFEGVLDGYRFEMHRIIRYRNSFLPRICGTIQESGNGARITGTMRLHVGTLAFMILWLGFVGLVCILSVIQSIAHGRIESMMLIPLGMLAFGIALPPAGFIPEAHKALRLLTELVDGSDAELQCWHWEP